MGTFLLYLMMRLWRWWLGSAWLLPHLVTVVLRLLLGSWLLSGIVVRILIVLSLCLPRFISHPWTCAQSVDTLMLWLRGRGWSLLSRASCQRLGILVPQLWRVRCIILRIAIMFDHFLLLRDQQRLWALIRMWHLSAIVWALATDHVFRLALRNVVIPWFLLAWSLLHGLIEIGIALNHIVRGLFVGWHLLVDIGLLVPYYPCYSFLCFRHIQALAGLSILVFINHSVFLLDLCLIWLAGLFSILTFASYVTLWLWKARRPVFAIFWWKFVLDVLVEILKLLFLLKMIIRGQVLVWLGRTSCQNHRVHVSASRFSLHLIQLWAVPSTNQIARSWMSQCLIQSRGWVFQRPSALILLFMRSADQVAILLWWLLHR